VTLAQFAINAGGTQKDQGHGKAKDAAGNVYVTGQFNSQSTRNLGGLLSDGGVTISSLPNTVLPEYLFGLKKWVVINPILV